MYFFADDQFQFCKDCDSPFHQISGFLELAILTDKVFDSTRLLSLAWSSRFSPLLLSSPFPNLLMFSGNLRYPVPALRVKVTKDQKQAFIIFCVNFKAVQLIVECFLKVKILLTFLMTFSKGRCIWNNNSDSDFRRVESMQLKCDHLLL